MFDKIASLKNILSKTWIQFLLFSGIMWLVFVLLEINRHIKDMIIGYHYWRKSDTYGQISNYYHNGLNFFDHSIYFNQLEFGGRALAEFPLFYYFVAFQQHIFGNYQIVAKVNWIILLFIGLFAIFKIAQHYLKHVGFSLLVSLMLFISPIFVVYSIDFLPDPIALYFVFIGFWLLLKSTLNNKKRTLILALILFSIAGMMKPFFLIPFLAFLITVLVNQLFIKKEFIRFKWLMLLPIFTTILWFIYVNWYNTAVGTDYFLSSTQAIWEFSSSENQRSLEVITYLWVPDYLHPIFLPIFLAMVLINLVWWNSKSILINLFYTTSLLGCLAFILLFAYMFKEHDYYIYPILFFLPLTIGKFIYHLKPYIHAQVLRHSLAGVSILLLLLSFNYTFERVQSRRMDTRINAVREYENYKNLDGFLMRNGIGQDDFVLAISDKSPSHALSLMNRKGWSGYQTVYLNKKLPYFIERGADYLIINKRVKLNPADTIGFTIFFIADTNDIFVYDLRE